MAPDAVETPEPHRDDWDDHWASYGKAGQNNPANSYRNRVVLRLLPAPEPGSVIFDIGSGQGQLALQMQDVFPQARVIGLEYSAEGVKRSSRAAEELGLAASFHPARSLATSCRIQQHPNIYRRERWQCVRRYSST